MPQDSIEEILFTKNTCRPIQVLSIWSVTSSFSLFPLSLLSLSLSLFLISLSVLIQHVYTCILSFIGNYYSPEADSIKVFRDFIDSLPYNDDPEVFGMHENANIAFQVRATLPLFSSFPLPLLLLLFLSPFSSCLLS